MDNIIKLNNEIQESKDNTIMRMMNDATWIGNPLLDKITPNKKLL